MLRGGEVRAISYSPEGRYLLTESDTGLTLYETTDYQRHLFLRSEGGGVTPAGTEKQRPIAWPRPW